MAEISMAQLAREIEATYGQRDWAVMSSEGRKELVRSWLADAYESLARDDQESVADQLAHYLGR